MLELETDHQRNGKKVADTKAAKRYSGALFELALAAQMVEQTHKDLQRVVTTLAESPEFMLVMRHPRLGRDEKKNILRRAFGGRVLDVVLDFLCLLVDRNRILLVPAIAVDFGERRDAWRNRVVAHVTTAIPITQREQEMFLSRLGQLTGRTIELVLHVDPSVIAGARVLLAGKMIDGTVATHLERMREQMKQVRVV